MRDRNWNYAEEYAEAYIASLVCCRPEGERKRSVRVVCVISIYVLGTPHGLCEFCVVCVRLKNTVYKQYYPDTLRSAFLSPRITRILVSRKGANGAEGRTYAPCVPTSKVYLPFIVPRSTFPVPRVPRSSFNVHNKDFLCGGGDCGALVGALVDEP